MAGHSPVTTNGGEDFDEMGSIIYVGVMTILWVVNLFTGTGLDSVYHVTQKTIYIVYALFALEFFLHSGQSRINKADFCAFGGMTACFLLSASLHGDSQQVVNYLWVFCMIYLMARFPVNNFVLWVTGLIYGGAGLLVLYIYNYGSAFSGWNDNSVAMIGMHSFLVFLVPFFDRSSFWDKFVVTIGTIVYSRLIFPTDSRSGVLFMFIGAAFALNLLPRGLILNGRHRRKLLLYVPLLIAAAVCLISTSGYMNALEMWSYEQSGKPIFNGRDDLWRHGFEILGDHFFLGSGKLNALNWHNSAIACLTAYGCLGYLCWIKSFGQILDRAHYWVKDAQVQGLIISFIVLFIQQSVELGFIGAPPGIIAYVLLGLLLGRAHYLEELEMRDREAYE